MAIVGSATAVAWVLSYNRVPQLVADTLLKVADTKMVFMLIVFILLVIVGMIMVLCQDLVQVKMRFSSS